MGKLILDTNSAPPKWWRQLSRALRFLLGSIITAISTSKMYTADLTLQIVFWLGLAIIFLQSCDIFFGTSQVTDEEKLIIKNNKSGDK